MGNYICSYDTITLFYDTERNYFVDEYGWPVYDIFKYMTPNQLLLFKHNQRSIRILADNHTVYEIVHPYGENIN